jgi:hypothetical protein
MDREISFFMDTADEQQFIELLKDTGCEIDRRSDRQWFVEAEGYKIQLLRSQVGNDAITLGRLAVRTPAKAEVSNLSRFFDKIGAWITTSYENRLIGRNTSKDGSGTVVDDIWVGPSAQSKALQGTQLRQSLNGKIAFEVRC